MTGRTSFTKRQKEQARQQRQRDKADRKNQRKEEKQSATLDDAAELQRLAQEQAALFDVGGTDEKPVRSQDKSSDQDMS